MNKLALLLVLVAAPVAAQESAAPWPVSAEGRVCTATQVDTTSGSGKLNVSYDAARQEVVLTSADKVASPLPQSGTIDLAVVFVDNGSNKFDAQWSLRHFTYTRQGDEVLFTTRFAGRTNVEQILSDLAHSRRIGFLQGREPVIDHPLAGLAAALTQLRECAAKASRPA